MSYVVVAETSDGLTSRSKEFETENEARLHAQKLVGSDALIRIETVGPTGMLCQPSPWPPANEYYSWGAITYRTMSREEFAREFPTS